MTHRAINPSSISAPAANYAHARLTTDATRWLHTSGVVPLSPDGTVPRELVAQAEVIWANIGAMLAAAEMTAADVVSVTTYVTPGHDLAPIMAVRDRALNPRSTDNPRSTGNPRSGGTGLLMDESGPARTGSLAASTLVIVAELARPEWLMEISIVAAN